MKLILIILFSSLNPITAKINQPNYNFTIKDIESFYPSKSIEEAKKVVKKFEIYEDSGNLKIIKFKMIKTDYTLDIYAQVNGDKILDTYIRMPQHFNHDLLLKDLQTKWKKQDKYSKKDRSSYYSWHNRDQMNILYHGSCSITCFPMFLEFASIEKSAKPLYQKFNDAI